MIIKPRRGKKSLWNVYKSKIFDEGEMLVESPEAGVGKGAVGIKFGDGTTDYEHLPYAIEPLSNIFKVQKVTGFEWRLNPQRWLAEYEKPDGYNIVSINVVSDTSTDGKAIYNNDACLDDPEEIEQYYHVEVFGLTESTNFDCYVMLVRTSDID